jgi:hypothetical protein
MKIEEGPSSSQISSSVMSSICNNIKEDSSSRNLPPSPSALGSLTKRPDDTTVASTSQQLAKDNLSLPQEVDPMKWAIHDSIQWIEWAVNEFNLDPVHVANFEIEGPELCSLTKDDFTMKAPTYTGDVLYSHLNLLRARVNSSGIITGTKTADESINYSSIGWSSHTWPDASIGDISFWLKAQQDYSITKPTTSSSANSSDHVYLPQIRSSVSTGFYPTVTPLLAGLQYPLSNTRQSLRGK